MVGIEWRSDIYEYILAVLQSNKSYLLVQFLHLFSFYRWEIGEDNEIPKVLEYISFGIRINGLFKFNVLNFNYYRKHLKVSPSRIIFFNLFYSSNFDSHVAIITFTGHKQLFVGFREKWGNSIFLQNMDHVFCLFVLRTFLLKGFAVCASNWYTDSYFSSTLLLKYPLLLMHFYMWNCFFINICFVLFRERSII